MTGAAKTTSVRVCGLRGVASPESPAALPGTFNTEVPIHSLLLALPDTLITGCVWLHIAPPPRSSVPSGSVQGPPSWLQLSCPSTTPSHIQGLRGWRKIHPPQQVLSMSPPGCPPAIVPHLGVDGSARKEGMLWPQADEQGVHCMPPIALGLLGNGTPCLAARQPQCCLVTLLRATPCHQGQATASLGHWHCGRGHWGSLSPVLLPTASVRCGGGDACPRACIAALATEAFPHGVAVANCPLR